MRGGGGDGTNATVDGSPIETMPGTLCSPSDSPPRAARRRRVWSGDDAPPSAPAMRFPTEVAFVSVITEPVLPASTPEAPACNVSAASGIGSDEEVAVPRDDAGAAIAVIGVDAGAVVLRKPRKPSSSRRVRQNH